jgi:hypothetical protein
MAALAQRASLIFAMNQKYGACGTGGAQCIMLAMISTRNPFPGMNPFLEPMWASAHARLVSYIADALLPDLPDDLIVRPEESLNVTTDETRRYRADAAIVEDTESWRQGISPKWHSQMENGVALADPIRILRSEEMVRWVEVRTMSGELVTVIEVLSRTNKTTGAAEYLRKQQDLISAGVNLVEIDLLRSGRYVLAAPLECVPPELAQAAGRICVTRRGGDFECYPCPLQQRLPAFRIPLRITDADVRLDLQPLLDRCYENGRYWKEDYGRELDPPLSAEDKAWSLELLRTAGLVE